MRRCRRSTPRWLRVRGDQGFARAHAGLLRGPSGLTEVALAQGFLGNFQTVLCVSECRGCRLLRARRAGGADGLTGIAHFLCGNASTSGQCQHQTGNYKPSPARMLPAIHAIISDAANPRQD